MTIFQALLSGIVQGIAEFFPISSTGHLVLLHHYFGFEGSQIFFDILLHIATGLAVLVYFRKDVASLFGVNKKLGFLIALGSMPTFAIGFIFADAVEKFFVDVKLVGIAFLVTGAWLITANILKHADTKEGALRPWKAIVIGAAQGAALIPGISRSGATIATGLLCGIGSKTAFRFSFLLLLPATLGAAVFKLKDVKAPLPPAAPMVYGCIAAFLAGILTLNLLNKILKQGRIHIFGFYCIILGLLVIYAQG